MARRDLILLAAVQGVAACITCFLVLGVAPGAVVLLSVAASAGCFLVALDRVFASDLNMVTAVNCLLFLPVGTDLFFALGFRATALNCMLASAHGRAHAALTDADTAAQAATHSAQLVAVVVLPATIGFSATVGFPLACLDEGILSLCRPHSPLYGESI